MYMASKNLRYIKEKLQKMYKMLIEGISQYQSSDDWKNLLDFISIQHNYSFHNLVLIMLQKPDATFVAGYKKWLKYGRHVKKGEHGIMIWAPRLKKVRQVKKEIVVEVDPVTGEEIEKEVDVEYYTNVLVGFFPVYVFDVSQTEGRPLPRLTHEVTSELPDDLKYDIFVSVCQNIADENDFTLKFEPILGSTHGYMNPVTRAIVIDNTYNYQSQIKTMIHEFTHMFLFLDGYTHGDASDIDNRVLTYNDEEVIVESVAYIVSKYLGLDTSEYSFRYISSYGGNPELLLDLGTVILRYAMMFLEK